VCRASLHQSDDGECLERGHRRSLSVTTPLVYLDRGSNVTWITRTSAGTGNGPGTVTFTVAPNRASPLDWTMTVAGQTFTVNQAVCRASLHQSDDGECLERASGESQLTTPGGCTWAAVSNVTWITRTSAGTGNARHVTFTVAPNRAFRPYWDHDRRGQTFTVNQAGVPCIFSSIRRRVSRGGIGGSLSVTTPAGCTWVAVSNVTWITRTSAGTGTALAGDVHRRAESEHSARTGTMSVPAKPSRSIRRCAVHLLHHPTTASVSSRGIGGSLSVTTPLVYLGGSQQRHVDHATSAGT